MYSIWCFRNNTRYSRFCTGLWLFRKRWLKYIENFFAYITIPTLSYFFLKEKASGLVLGYGLITLGAIIASNAKWINSMVSYLAAEKFCQRWNSCWYLYFHRFSDQSSELLLSSKSQCTTYSMNALCLNLLIAESNSKTRTLQKTENKGSNTTLYKKGIFILVLQDKSYQKIYNNYSKLESWSRVCWKTLRITRH